jgi:hypothetical protein
MYGMHFVPHRERGVLPLAQSITAVQESISYFENPQKEHMNKLLWKNAASLGAFAKLQKSSNSFVLCLSVASYFFKVHFNIISHV